MIETHLLWSVAVTAIFVVLTIARLITRLRGQDAGASVPFAILVIAGTGVLTMSGMTGGDLVFDYGINVRGIDPLLDP